MTDQRTQTQPWTAPGAGAGVMPYALAASIALLFVAAYARTFASLVNMWWGSDDYTHGFLVPVIALYIVWRKKHTLLETRTEPAVASGAAVMALAGCVLVAGKLGSVVILEELSIPLMLAGLVLMLAGRLFLKALWFPLAYLLFMVKMFGEGSERFHWPFQILASNIGVWVLQTAGIPAYKEAQFIQLPNIVLEVASACSGLRFLISIIAIGIPLAWLTQRSWARRTGLVAFAVLIAVLANGARVALIGVWAFYGGEVVHGPMHVFQGMFVAWIGFIALFAGAWFLSGKGSPQAPENPLKPMAFVKSLLARVSSNAGWTKASVAAITILAVTLGASLFYRTSPVALGAPLSSLPETLGGWSASGVTARDFLVATGAAEEYARIYEKDGASLRVYVSYYADQAQGSEMVNYRNSWKLHRSERVLDVSTPSGRTEKVNAASLKENNDRRFAMFWYQMDGKVMADRVDVKLWTIWKAVSSRKTNGALVIVSAPAADQAGAGRLEAQAAGLAGLVIPEVAKLLNENAGTGLQR